MRGIMLAEDKNLGVGAVTTNQAGGLQTIHLGHADVHDDDIGQELSGFLDCFHTVSGFAGNEEVFPRFEERAEPSPEYFVVVDN